MNNTDFCEECGGRLSEIEKDNPLGCNECIIASYAIASGWWADVLDHGNEVSESLEVLDEMSEQPCDCNIVAATVKHVMEFWYRHVSPYALTVLIIISITRMIAEVTAPPEILWLCLCITLMWSSGYNIICIGYVWVHLPEDLEPLPDVLSEVEFEGPNAEKMARIGRVAPRSVLTACIIFLIALMGFALPFIIHAW